MVARLLASRIGSERCACSAEGVDKEDDAATAPVGSDPMTRSAVAKARDAL